MTCLKECLDNAISKKLCNKHNKILNNYENLPIIASILVSCKFKFSSQHNNKNKKSR